MVTLTLVNPGKSWPASLLWYNNLCIFICPDKHRYAHRHKLSFWEESSVLGHRALVLGSWILWYTCPSSFSGVSHNLLDFSLTRQWPPRLPGSYSFTDSATTTNSVHTLPKAVVLLILQCLASTISSTKACVVHCRESSLIFLPYLKFIPVTNWNLLHMTLCLRKNTALWEISWEQELRHSWRGLLWLLNRTVTQRLYYALESARHQWLGTETNSCDYLKNRSLDFNKTYNIIHKIRTCSGISI